MDEAKQCSFRRKDHILYFVHNLKTLPKQYTQLDTNRLTLVCKRVLKTARTEGCSKVFHSETKSDAFLHLFFSLHHSICFDCLCFFCQVHFAVQSLDILGFFENDDNFETFNISKQAIINWIYNLLTLPTSNDKRSINDEPNTRSFWENAGFKGGTFSGGTFEETRGLDRSSLGEGEEKGYYSYQCWKYDYGHIAMTYTALCTLVTLGDDLKGVDRKCIVRALKKLQLENGR